MGSSHKHHTIGEVSELFGVTLRTLRFYQDRGLINPFRPDGTNQRLYSDLHLQQIKAIIRMRDLGFTLTEIKEAAKRSRTGVPVPTKKAIEEQRKSLCHMQENIRKQIDVIDSMA